MAMMLASSIRGGGLLACYVILPKSPTGLWTNTEVEAYRSIALLSIIRALALSSFSSFAFLLFLVASFFHLVWLSYSRFLLFSHSP